MLLTNSNVHALQGGFERRNSKMSNNPNQPNFGHLRQSSASQRFGGVRKSAAGGFQNRRMESMTSVQARKLALAAQANQALNQPR